MAVTRVRSFGGYTPHHTGIFSLPESYSPYADSFANFQLTCASNLTKNMEKPGALNKWLNGFGLRFGFCSKLNFKVTSQ